MSFRRGAITQKWSSSFSATTRQQNDVRVEYKLSQQNSSQQQQHKQNQFVLLRNWKTTYSRPPRSVPLFTTHTNNNKQLEEEDVKNLVSLLWLSELEIALRSLAADET